ncbi:SNF2 family DNA or RNA helicase [Enterococcus sp. PF1-24]|uniref:DEAD/DEAH box helicase n=1 Tax=unclassified Enterococcus TaxID=2608891 RepID=UPI002473FE95|nr:MULTISPECIES: DEAD/DEAH box helicase [unclassified Enterococcus]MDH6363116.1 SNF2 family DNA or RNA helicase [Enterococcus sp. PFB1-1]MDH6400210.1 SNF2 family DNA or RNA helicase [Enterococcus sp. PF1-24]
MKYEPHSYQQYATKYIEDHSVCAVLLDMGLGKTSITLTALSNLLFDSFEIHKVLVIAPLRVARDTWSAEIEKWEHLQNLKYSIAVGTEQERLSALKAQADIYIINRENVQWLIEKSGISFDFDMVIIDELSSFKNYQSKRFKALMKARPKIKRIVGLTGTPSSNGLMDLFAEFKLLDMGARLGRFIGQYRSAYFTPDKRNGQIVFSYKPLPYAEDAIYKQISDISISMKSTDYLKMPKLISSEYKVQLSPKEQKAYDNLKSELVLNLPNGEITAANAAALSGKLSQMANGAIYSDDENIIEIHGRKLDALEDIIESANGKPLLVAYWFKHDLTRIEKRLHELHISFAKLDSSDSISRWNNGELPVALIHPASAGHGLNLQSGGSTIVWFGLTWSLELYQQTNARLWRQGQSAKTVVVQHILTAGTIDEQIIKALQTKNTTQSALIDAVKANL